jgi:hypothetical protein
MPGQNQNILQAPAEGFGQNVTFSYRPDPRDTPSIDGAGRAGHVRADVQGAPATGFRQSPHHIDAGPADPTMAVLQKIGGEFLQSRIKQERAAAFVTGMQRAANGEAIRDIAEGQPWYANIFGEADVVEGARVYTAQAKASEAAAAIEDAMPEVRKLDNQAASAYFGEIVSKHMTGDAVADAAIMQGFARTLPGTMRRQAKEHYAFRQEQASEAESRALLSAADLLQKRAGSDKQTDDEYSTQAVHLIAGMRPAAGRDVASWTKARTSDLMSLAQGGNFHAVNAIRSAGMLDLLPTESRVKIESALDTAENRTVARKSFEYADEIGAIAGQAEVFSTDLSPQDTQAKLAALNERFRKETGIDRDLITMDKGSGIIKDAHVSILREGERRIRESEQTAKDAAKAGDKERAGAVRAQGALQAISLGQAGPATRSLPDGVVHEQFMNAWREVGRRGPAAQAQMMMLNYSGAGSGDGYVNPAIKNLYERRIDLAIGAQMPAEFLGMHADYRALKNENPALADAYLGKHAYRMELFDSLLKDGTPGDRGETLAYVAAFGSQDLPRPKVLTQKQHDTARASLENHHDSSWWKVLSQQREPLRSDQSEQATNALSGQISRFMTLPGMTPDQAVRRAIEESRREEGTDLLGGFFIRGGRGMQPLSGILRTRRAWDSAKGTGEDAPDVWDSAVKNIVADRAKRIGASASDPIAIIRNPDVSGVAWLDVYYTGPDGRQVPVRISSDDIKNFARDPSGRSVSGPVTN